GPEAKSAVPVLVEILKKDEVPPAAQAVQREAASALGSIAADPAVAVPALAEALQAKSAYLRVAAAGALGRFGSEARPAITALSTALQDKEVPVRVEAALALWRVDRQAQTVLPQLLEGLRASQAFGDRWPLMQALTAIGADAVPGVTRVIG